MDAFENDFKSKDQQKLNRALFHQCERYAKIKGSNGNAFMLRKGPKII